jgi:hypothetical protein
MVHGQRTIDLDVLLRCSNSKGILELPPNRTPKTPYQAREQYGSQNEKIPSPKNSNARTKQYRGGFRRATREVACVASSVRVVSIVNHNQKRSKCWISRVAKANADKGKSKARNKALLMRNRSHLILLAKTSQSQSDPPSNNLQHPSESSLQATHLNPLLHLRPRRILIIPPQPILNLLINPLQILQPARRVGQETLAREIGASLLLAPDLLLPQADAERERGRDAGLAVLLHNGVACSVAPGLPVLDREARFAGFELGALLEGLVGAEERVVESGGEGVEGGEVGGVGEELVAEEGEGLFHVRGEDGFAGWGVEGSGFLEGGRLDSGSLGSDSLESGCLESGSLESGSLESGSPESGSLESSGGSGGGRRLACGHRLGLEFSFGTARSLGKDSRDLGDESVNLLSGLQWGRRDVSLRDGFALGFDLVNLIHACDDALGPFELVAESAGCHSVRRSHLFCAVGLDCGEELVPILLGLVTYLERLCLSVLRTGRLELFWTWV